MIKKVGLIVLLCATFIWAHPIDVNISTQTLALGEPFKLTVETESPLSDYKVKFLNKEFELFYDSTSKDRYKYIAYLGAKRTAVGGNYILLIDLKCKNKDRFYQNYKMTLDHPAKPKKGKVKLTKKAKKLSAKKKDYSNEGSLLAKKFKLKTNKQYFKGPFIKPAKGRISSGFATVRTYNNGRTYSHAGVDIANIKGTTIIAPQDGVVVLSEELSIHGNTLVVDHGFGVVSVFCHLEKRLHPKGTFVTKGTEIATMGMTGVVSGVHLHWGLSVQNVRVNPLYWLELTESKLTTSEKRRPYFLQQLSVMN